MNSSANNVDDWRRRARALFQQGEPGRAAALQRRMLAVETGRGLREFRDHLYLAFYLTASGSPGAAADVLESVADLGEGEIEYHLNLGTIYIRLARLADALDSLKRARSLSPANPHVPAQMARVLGALGRDDEAVRSGELALLNLAREVAGQPRYPLPQKSPELIDLDSPEQNIIAMAMADYTLDTVTAALRNAACASVLYPGWTMRLYVRPDLPEEIRQALGNAGVQLAAVAESAGRLNAPEFWPLHALTDPAVRYVLVRDLRNLLNLRERDAVQEWLGSGQWFHVMRDHMAHASLVIPGMWGCATGVLPSADVMMQNYRDPATQSGSRMMLFLQHCVWPSARKSCLQHDAYFRVMKSKDLPCGERRNRDDFVGNPVAAKVSLPAVVLPDYEPPQSATGGLVGNYDQLLF